VGKCGKSGEKWGKVGKDVDNCGKEWVFGGVFQPRFGPINDL
jgi:hypothetical protein